MRGDLGLHAVKLQGFPRITDLRSVLIRQEPGRAVGEGSSVGVPAFK